MGNCQAIDNASLVIQHPSGKVERLYSDVSAAQVMKLNPGHYVALLLTTTLYTSRQPPPPPPPPPPPSTTTVPVKPIHHVGVVAKQTQPLRVTRIKLLRPTESLTVGHIYRLITTQEVMKGLMAKKNGKISDYMNKPIPTENLARSNQMKRSEKDRRTASSTVATKPKGWHPSLNSISEASS